MFTAPKIFRALLISSPSPTHGNHWSFYCLYKFAFYSTSFDKCIQPCDPKFIKSTFTLPRVPLCSLPFNSCLTPPEATLIWFLFLQKLVLLVQEINKYVILEYVLFCIWLLSFIHVFEIHPCCWAYHYALLLKKHFIVWIYHSLFMRSPMMDIWVVFNYYK